MRVTRAILMAAALTAGAATPGLAAQESQSGQPLEVYCNTAPDLRVQRADAIDNWVRICTVWFSARCPDTDPPTAETTATPPGR